MNTKEREGDTSLKKFFGGLFIEKEKLEEAGIYHPIKLEYYKRIDEKEEIKGNYRKYGISVVKTEYIPNSTKIENKDIKYICSDEEQIEKILEIFKENQVTPISVEDIICDLAKKIL